MVLLDAGAFQFYKAMTISDQPLVLEITQYDVETLEANKKKLLAQITPLIDFFAFDKVKRIMTMLDWEWTNLTDGKRRVPHVSELIDTAKMLLTHVATENIDESSTGGFRASKIKSDNSDDMILRLEFIAESYDFDCVELINRDREEVSGMTISNPEDELPF